MLFGTDDVIFVPENQCLQYHDVYHARVMEVDLRRVGLRIDAPTFQKISDHLQVAMNRIQESDRFKEKAITLDEETRSIIRSLALISGVTASMDFHRLATGPEAPPFQWWLGIDDEPAESYHAEDYEQPLANPVDALSFDTYGLVRINRLDGLEISLNNDDPRTRQPLILRVPDGALKSYPMDPRQPLPLVDEFCGATGVSTTGKTVNISPKAEIVNYHQFCSPLATLGEHLFVTIYFHHHLSIEVSVLGRIRHGQGAILKGFLEKSNFKSINSGRYWNVLERDGDIVHIYWDLEGKESDGIPTMPSFLWVAQAQGSDDPILRGELLEAITSMEDLGGES